MPVTIYGDFNNCFSSINALEKLKSRGIEHIPILVSLEEFREGTSKPINALRRKYSTIPIIFTPQFLNGGNDALTESKLVSLVSKSKLVSLVSNSKHKPMSKRRRSRSKSRPRSRSKSKKRKRRSKSR